MSWAPLVGECVLVTRLGGAHGAREAEAARASELLQPVRTHELFERVDLLRRADELEDDRVGADVGDACADRLAERQQLRPLRGGCGDLDERELALDGVAGN